MVTLHSLHPHKRPSRKRVGRGHGSGLGTTAGRGTKGQRARTGGRRHTLRRSLKALYERLPKARGSAVGAVGKPLPISLADLERHFTSGDRVTREALVAKHLLPKHTGRVIILGPGTLSKALTVEAHRLSGTARRVITAAGGTIVLLPDLTHRPPLKRFPRPRKD